MSVATVTDSSSLPARRCRAPIAAMRCFSPLDARPSTWPSSRSRWHAQTLRPRPFKSSSAGVVYPFPSVSCRRASFSSAKVRRSPFVLVQFLSPTMSPCPCASAEPVHAVQFHRSRPDAAIFIAAVRSTAASTSQWLGRSGELLTVSFHGSSLPCCCDGDRLLHFIPTVQDTPEHHHRRQFMPPNPPPTSATLLALSPPQPSSRARSW